MQSLQGVLSPAKLNLFLHITDQRADGYHLLQSVFMLIDWYDSLDFELRADGQIQRIDVDLDNSKNAQKGHLPLPEQDLCVRAALALKKSTGSSLGARISLCKTIPQQAGMGGGSSNAATTLLALNRLWKLNLSREELMRIAEPLGADVPFFLMGSSAWVEGIGEKLTPITLQPAKWVVLKPKNGVSTQEIFRDPLLQRGSKTVTIFDFAEQPFDFGHNDLQPVAERLCPEITQAIEWLGELGLNARMTGSGSAVFANLSAGTGVEFDANQLNSLGWELKVCSNLDKHPLSDWVSSDK